MAASANLNRAVENRDAKLIPRSCRDSVIEREPGELMVCVGTLDGFDDVHEDFKDVTGDAKVYMGIYDKLGTWRLKYQYFKTGKKGAKKSVPVSESARIKWAHADLDPSSHKGFPMQNTTTGTAKINHHKAFMLFLWETCTKQNLSKPTPVKPKTSSGKTQKGHGKKAHAADGNASPISDSSPLPSSQASEFTKSQSGEPVTTMVEERSKPRKRGRRVSFARPEIGSDQGSGDMYLSPPRKRRREKSPKVGESKSAVSDLRQSLKGTSKKAAKAGQVNDVDDEMSAAAALQQLEAGAFISLEQMKLAAKEYRRIHAYPNVVPPTKMIMNASVELRNALETDKKARLYDQPSWEQWTSNPYPVDDVPASTKEGSNKQRKRGREKGRVDVLAGDQRANGGKEGKGKEGAGEKGKDRDDKHKGRAVPTIERTEDEDVQMLDTAPDQFNQPPAQVVSLVDVKDEELDLPITEWAAPKDVARAYEIVNYCVEHNIRPGHDLWALSAIRAARKMLCKDMGWQWHGDLVF